MVRGEHEPWQGEQVVKADCKSYDRGFGIANSEEQMEVVF